jgi:hypothetical protein
LQDAEVGGGEERVPAELHERGRFKYASDRAFADLDAGWRGTRGKQRGRCEQSPMRMSDSLVWSL